MKRAFLIPATSLAFVAKAMPAHTGHEHTGGTDVKIIGEVIDPVCHVSHAGDEGKTFAREVAVEPETSRGAVEHPWRLRFLWNAGLRRRERNALCSISCGDRTDPP